MVANAHIAEDRLADFTRDKRIVVLAGMAALVGLASAFVAQILVWLIAVITNLAFYQRFSAVFRSPEQNRLGLLAVLIPVIGGLIIGIIEALGATYISSEYKDVLSFLIIIVVLLVRPRGLFPEPIAEKL